MHVYENGVTAREVYQELFSNTEYASKSIMGHGVNCDPFCQGFESILDVGCGKSNFARMVAAKYGMKQAAVCDVALAAIEYQRDHGMTGYTADLGSGLPFPDGEFEVVTCFDVLEHIPPYEAEHAAAELVRVASKRVLCTIAHDHARAKGPHGEPLHLTIQPKEWWLALFFTLGVNVTLQDVVRYKLPDRDVTGTLWIMDKHDAG